MADAWLVVGAGGKPKKGARQHASPIAPGHSHDTNNTTTAAGAASRTDQPSLPGWDSSCSAAGQQGLYAADAGHGRRSNSRRAALRAPRTFEEQVDALQRQVEQCRFEVASSHFYRRLKAAFACTSSHQLTNTCNHNAAATNCSHAAAPLQGSGPLNIHLQSSASHHIDASTEAPQRTTAALLQQHLPHQATDGCLHDGRHPVIESTRQGLISQSLQSTVEPPSKIDPEVMVHWTCHGHRLQGSVTTPWPMTVTQMVVFGLGSMQESRNSRYQLALGLLLRSELLPCLSLPPEVYDPILTPVDMALLKRLDWTVLERNEECARRADRPTLFYLPHLEGHLCDKLLLANLGQLCNAESHEQGSSSTALDRTVSTATLGHCVLLANSFATYQERWDMCGRGKPGAGRPDRPEAMLRLLAAGAVLEAAVPQEPSFPAPSAFNDTSLHLFHASVLRSLI